MGKVAAAAIAGGVGGRRRGRFRGSGPRLAKPKTLEGRGSEGELPWTLRAVGENLSRRTPRPAAMGLAEARGQRCRALQIKRKLHGEEEREMASSVAQRVGAEAAHFAGLKSGGIGDPGGGSPNTTSKSEAKAVTKRERGGNGSGASQEGEARGKRGGRSGRGCGTGLGVRA